MICSSKAVEEHQDATLEVGKRDRFWPLSHDMSYLRPRVARLLTEIWMFL